MHLLFGTYSKNEVPPVQCTYIIKCVPSGHFYYGSTKNLKTRVRMHRHRLRHGAHTRVFNELFRQYGEDAFTIDVVQVYDEYNDAQHGERKLIVNETSTLLANDGVYANAHIGRISSNGKLSSDDIIGIFASTLTVQETANIYNVSHSMVSHIRMGRRHRDVIIDAGLW